MGLGLGSGNTFQSPEQQENELMSKGWDAFNKATEAIAKDNEDADKEKRIKQLPPAGPDANFFAEESQKGHETSSSALD